GAVAADDADALAGFDGQVDIFKQQRAADAEVDALELEEGHGAILPVGPAGRGAVGAGARRHSQRGAPTREGTAARSGAARLRPDQRSRIATTPMPPAVQIETRARPPPRSFSCLAAVATMRAPVAAKGWPAASEEPTGLIFAGSMRPSGASRPRRLRQ